MQTLCINLDKLIKNNLILHTCLHDNMIRLCQPYLCNSLLLFTYVTYGLKCHWQWLATQISLKACRLKRDYHTDFNEINIACEWKSVSCSKSLSTNSSTCLFVVISIPQWNLSHKIYRSVTARSSLLHQSTKTHSLLKYKSWVICCLIFFDNFMWAYQDKWMRVQVTFYLSPFKTFFAVGLWLRRGWVLINK